MGKDKRKWDRLVNTNVDSLFIQDSYGVRKDYLWSGIELVPAQTESWTCGVNSGARFAAMLGQTILNYQHFMDTAPYYNAAIFFGPKIGPNPGRLQDHLRAQAELQGSDIGQRCTGNFQPQLEIIEKSLRLERPVLALIENNNLLHWVNIIRCLPATNEYGILNTSGATQKINKDTFTFYMDCEGCAADAFGFIEKYNTITCTNSCNNKRFYERFFDKYYYANMYGDLKEAFGYDGYKLFRHFLEHGIKEGRSAKPNACFKSYLERYSDLKKEFGDDCKKAAIHYRDHGEKEGRNILP